jgi:predicted dehydrogenase
MTRDGAMTLKHTNIGVAGLGSIGRRHAVVALEAGARVHVFDPVSEARDEALRLGVHSVHDRLESLFDVGLEALIVASPDRHHRPQVLAAAERGITTLVEKPLAHTLEDGIELVGSLEGLPGAVLVGYVLHYCRPLLKVEQIVRDGDLGELASFHVQLGAYQTLVQARSRFDAHEHGTIYVDYSHEWDYVGWLAGTVTRGIAVERTVESLPLVQRPNVVDGLLELADGCVGSFHLDYVQEPSVRSLTLIGTEGALEVDVPRGRIALKGRGTGGALRSVVVAQARNELFSAQLAHLLEVVRGAEPRVSVAHGLAALGVAEGLRRSARERSWVDFGEPGKFV